MKMEVGQKAPDFTLYASDRSKVSLSDFKGKNVLLLFFPQAFTGTCTEELCNVRDNIDWYKHVNAEVVGISVDSTATLHKFKELEGYNFTLLSDFNKEVSALYGSIYEIWFSEMRGVSKRSAFVIDKAGILQYAEVLENADDVPDFEAIKSKLASLD
ncbi:MAG: redoxin domain-containing protein [Chitinophagaceae bacterium]|nr:redoxin domain-containing protein [Chitinophagaceae bacterium]